MNKYAYIYRYKYDRRVHYRQAYLELSRKYAGNDLALEMIPYILRRRGFIVSY